MCRRPEQPTAGRRMRETEGERGGRPKGGGTRVLPWGGPGDRRRRYRVKCRTTALDSLGLSSPKWLSSPRGSNLMRSDLRDVRFDSRIFATRTHNIYVTRRVFVSQKCHRVIWDLVSLRSPLVVENGHIARRFRVRSRRSLLRSARACARQEWPIRWAIAVAFNPRARWSAAIERLNVSARCSGVISAFLSYGTSDRLLPLINPT